MAEHYYTEELTAVPFATLKRGMSQAAPAPLAFCLAARLRLRGLLGWPLAPTYATGEPGSERIVPRDEIPPRAYSRWAPIVEQLADLGFQPLEYVIAETIGEKENAAALFLDAPGSTIATLEWIRMRGAERPIEKAPLELNSYTDEDPEIMTGAANREDLAWADMFRLDFVDMFFLPIRLPIREIYEKHQDRIQGRPVYRMTPEAALKEHEKRRNRRFQAVLKSGLMRPLTPAEVARVQTMRLE